MNLRTILCGLLLVAVCMGGNSSGGEIETSLVTYVNANQLLCTIVKRHGFSVVLLGPEAQSVPVHRRGQPSETVTITREHNIESRGRRYRFVRDHEGVGGVQLGVFPDPDTASKIFKDHLRHTSMGPDKDLTPELGERALRWSFRGEGKDLIRILFIRDNVVVSIHVFSRHGVPKGGTTETIMALSRAIDAALASGTRGVQRGNTLRTPRVTAIEFPADTPERTSLTARIRVVIPENPEDKDGREVEVVRSLPFYTPGLSAENKAKPEHTVTYYVTYVTPGCVIASRDVTITLRPR
jgi:hypothetical protein